MPSRSRTSTARPASATARASAKTVARTSAARKAAAGAASTKTKPKTKPKAKAAGARNTPTAEPATAAASGNAKRKSAGIAIGKVAVSPRAAGKDVVGKKVAAKVAKRTSARATSATAKRAKRKPPLMPAADVETFFSRLRELNPQPKTELEYTTPFELLVAVVLSAQATDVGVNKATRRLFPVANTPQAIAALGVEGLKPYIATIGLFNTKAANVVALCERLLAEHDGDVPRSREALQALPGVGRKTANVVLNTAFGEPTMAVDTHIFRVSNRTGLAPGKDVLAVEHALLARVPEAFLRDAHHWLILHGRYTCKALKPECGGCPVRDVCLFETKAPPHSG
jgi:endonuclease-3